MGGVAEVEPGRPWGRRPSPAAEAKRHRAGQNGYSRPAPLSRAWQVELALSLLDKWGGAVTGEEGASEYREMLRRSETHGAPLKKTKERSRALKTEPKGIGEVRAGEVRAHNVGQVSLSLHSFKGSCQVSQSRYEHLRFLQFHHLSAQRICRL